MTDGATKSPFQPHQPDPERFRATWNDPTGLPATLSAVNNVRIGARFMITAMVFFVIGGLMALLMRLQLAVPENDLIGPQLFNELFTMHGATMMYLFAVPFLEGLALYLLPVMLGSRDLAFPRLSQFGYWCYLFGGLIFYASFFFGMAPDAGWFAYTPLSTDRFTGKQTDFFLLGLSLVEISGLTAAAEIVVTILKLRCMGMALHRMPLFAWTMLVTGVMILFAFTPLLMATVLLELDRTVGTRFFDTNLGGSSLLWQHLFWFFGHPEVYIAFLPATGITSMVIAAAARRPIVGYALVVVAIIIIGFVSFGLWVHHMFTTGLPELSMAFFTAASLMIAIASGIQIFAWIATLWGSRPAWTVPLLFVLGFFVIFVAGGMTGVMIAIVPFDKQVHDTYFIVAHFHYVLIGGVVFPVFAGLFHWMPKMTGRLLHHGLGVWSFVLMFVGFNLTFFPMHIAGMLGLPRRVYTYPAELEVGGYNLVATVGAFILGLGSVLFLVNVFWSLRWGAKAPGNPWKAGSLEWAADSPTPPFSFAVPPIIASREPVWEGEEQAGDPADTESTIAQAMAFAPDGWRATLVTDAITARPEAIAYLPGPTYVPLFAALGLLVAAVGILVDAYLLSAAGMIFMMTMLVDWLWPRRNVYRMLRDSDLSDKTGLPILTTGPTSVAWWGMITLITILATAMGAMLFSYFYLWLYSSDWPQHGLPLPDLLLPGIAHGCAVAAAGLAYLSGQVLRSGGRRPAAWLMLAAAGAGVLFITLELSSLLRSGFALQTNAYASAFFVSGGLMLLYAAIAVVIAAATAYRVARVREYDMTIRQVQLVTMYHAFVAATAVVVYVSIHISPHVI